MFLIVSVPCLLGDEGSDDKIARYFRSLATCVNSFFNMSGNELLVKHLGGCHCGAVKFEALAPARLEIHKCNCSICTKKQLIQFVVPDDRFKLLQGQDSLSLYTFNTNAAKHYFCKVCGVQSFYKPRSHPEGISIMLHCLDSKNLEVMGIQEFDGQNWEASMAKRSMKYS